MNDEYTEISMEEYDNERKAKEAAKPLLELLKTGIDYVSARRDQLVENMAFYQNNISLLKQYKENRPWVIQMNTPYASMAIDKRVASLVANDYIGELIPMRSQDVDVMKTVQSVYKDEWERMEMDMKIDDAISTSAVVREGYVHVYFDKEEGYGSRKGEICAKAIDTNAVLIDPKARSYRDAMWIAIAGRITYEDACERYPEFSKFLSKSDNLAPSDRGENYIENDYTSQQNGILTIYTMYRREGKKIMQYILVDRILVAEKHISGLKRFPIAQMRWKRAAQSAYGIALMDDILSLQKAISSIESAITNTAVAYASPSVIIREGSGLKPAVIAKTMGAPGVVYVSKIPIQEAMQAVSPAKVEDKIVNLKREFEMAIDKIAGISDQFTGDIGTAGNTSGGAKLAVERAKIVEAGVIRNIEEFVEDLTLIVMDYILTLYSGEVVESRTTDKATGDMTFTNRALPDSAKDLKFSYYINLNMKTSYSKERERDVIKEIYQMERQYNAPVMVINELDILESYDLSNKEELRKRYKELQANSADNKATTITKIVAAAAKYQIDPALTEAAIADVIRGDKQNNPNLDEFMKQSQGMAQQMSAEVQNSADDLKAQGLDPASVDEAQQMMSAQGQQPSPTDLNLM